MKTPKNSDGLTDEVIAEAVKEYNQAVMDQLPDPRDFHHEFSPEYRAKMQALQDSISADHPAPEDAQ